MRDSRIGCARWMKKDMLFVFNPRAGKGQLKNKLMGILDRFTKGGFRTTVHVTQAPRDAYHVVKQYAGKYDIVACSGGDGTMNEVVSGLIDGNHHTLVGYIPAGTTNDFARSLRISRDMFKAADTIVDGVPYLCDVGQFQDKIFTYVAAFGAFTDVTYQTPQQSKNILGHLAYLLEGVKRIPSLTSYHIKIQYDNHIIENDFIVGIVSNSTSIGGIKGLSGKDVLMDDGLFEATFIKMPRNPLDLQNIINALVMQQPNPNWIYTFHADQLTISSEKEISWTLDGEFGGNHTQVEIHNLQHALTFIRPYKK